MELDRFFRLAYARHRIYVKRSLGLPAPWTDDPIFRDFFFCNVSRKIDKTTAWMIDRIVTPLRDDEAMWQPLMLARYFSRISTLEDLERSGVFDPSRSPSQRMSSARAYIEEYMRTRETDRDRICSKILFTGAFIIWAPKDISMQEYVLRLIDRLHKTGYGKIVSSAGATVRGTFDLLREQSGTGAFMANQYACDLTYAERYLARAPDVDSWVSQGPGSLRGLSRLKHGTPTVPPSLRRTFLDDALEIRDAWRGFNADNLKAEIASVAADCGEQPMKIRSLYSIFDRVDLQTVEHWLCEYDKYLRGGSSKRRFSAV